MAKPPFSVVVTNECHKNQTNDTKKATSIRYGVPEIFISGYPPLRVGVAFDTTLLSRLLRKRQGLVRTRLPVLKGFHFRPICWLIHNNGVTGMAGAAELYPFDLPASPNRRRLASLIQQQNIVNRSHPKQNPGV